MFRDPNINFITYWRHIPVAHGRSSSIMASGEPIYRPRSTKLNDQENPVLGLKIIRF